MARTPTQRVGQSKSDLVRLRRKYKANLTMRAKLLPVEAEYTRNIVSVLKLAGYNRTQIAQAVGISRAQVREIMEEPAFQEQMAILYQRIPQAAVDLLQGLMIEAVMSIADVMRKSTDDRYILQAAESILDRGGAPKASRQDKHSINEERTVITDDGLIDRLREASPEVQEEAAQIIERLEALLSSHAGEK